MSSGANTALPLTLQSFRLAKPLNQIDEVFSPIVWSVCEGFSMTELRLARNIVEPILPSSSHQEAVLGFLTEKGIIVAERVSYVDHLQNPTILTIAKESAPKTAQDTPSNVGVSAFEPADAFAGDEAPASKPKAAAVDVAEAFADSEVIAVELDEENGGSFMID